MASDLTGQALQATLVVNNNSSRQVRPRFALCDEKTYTAGIKETELKQKLMERRCTVVKPYTMETVTQVFTIPTDLTPSTLNCSFIQLQYWLEVNWCGTLLGYSVF